MKIGILSDTHDQWERTRTAVALLKAEGASALFHCGDLTRSNIVTACSSLPCYFVFGNNDLFHMNEIRLAISETPGAVCLEWGGEVQLHDKRIALTHSHDLQELKRMLALRPDYLLTGHSHIADDTRDGATRRINPGALHRARTYSIALLNLVDDSLRFLTLPKSP